VLGFGGKFRLCRVSGVERGVRERGVRERRVRERFRVHVQGF
jgi:hypothetical protein